MTDPVLVRGGSGLRAWLRRWRFDIAIVAFIVGVSAFVARPLVEYWAWTLDFNSLGLTGEYSQFLHTFPLRPLHGTPAAVDWILGHGSTFGFVVGFSVLLSLKYFAWRWALSVLDAALWKRRLIVVVATVMPLWPESWYLRQSAGELAMIFFAIAVGSALRSRERIRWRWVVLGAVAGGCGVASYQALVVLTAVAPLALAAGAGPGRSRAARTARACMPMLGAVLLYALYVVLARATLGPGSDYETTNVDPTRWATSLALIRSVGNIYSTAYGNTPATLGVIGFIAAAVIGPRSRGELRRAWLIAGAAIALLPLAALPYIVTLAWASDPGRILLPTSAALVVLLVALCLEFPSDPRDASPMVSAATVLAIVVSAATALTALGWVGTQKAVVQEVTAAKATGARVVMVEDWSGRIGDVYTFLPGILQNAVDAKGMAITAYVCQAPGTVPNRPYAEHLGLAPPPLCTDPSLPTPGAVVVVTQDSDGQLHYAIQPAPVA